MNMLGIDVGSSSVKAAILNGSKIIAQTTVGYPSRLIGHKAEVSANTLLQCIAHAIDALEGRAKCVDWINFAVMAPSWVAMDARGQAISPIVTHQDRRSTEQAQELERRLGRSRLLSITGNRPFPGGISSTTSLWFTQNEPQRMKKADLIGHVSTLLIRKLTGQRRIDPSQASFTGLYETMKLGDWNTEICKAIGISPALLPQIADSNEIAGYVTAASSRRFHLIQGTPVLCGMVDGSSIFYLTDLRPGQLANICGSTDVLAKLTSKPRISEQLLTRALGCGRRWLNVATLAAGGSSLQWAKQQLFGDWADEKFWSYVKKLAKSSRLLTSNVQFSPYLAGDRMAIEQRYASLENLSLATTREDILKAMLYTLIDASAQRLKQLSVTHTRGQAHESQEIIVTGGADNLLRQKWPGQWRYHHESNATVRGLGMLEPRQS